MSGSSRAARWLAAVGWLYVAAGALLNLWLLASPAEPAGAAARKVFAALAVLLAGWGLVTLRWRQPWVVNGNLALVAWLVVGPAFLEVFIRGAIALQVKPFRQPNLYADPYADDEHWKLYYAWIDREQAVAPPWATRDPLLGWTALPDNPGRVLGATTAAGEHQPAIVFYGDSFLHWLLRGEGGEIVTQRLPGYALQNLAVPGYGLDQMALRFQWKPAGESATAVVFGMLTEDIDRTVMTVRHGPKPYFVLEGSRLRVAGVPITERPQEWVERHPPQTKSYVLALAKRMYWLLGAGGNPKETRYRRDEKQILASRLLAEVVASARAQGVPLLFVIFYPPDELGGTGWREVFLKQQLSLWRIPYLDTKPLLLRAAERERQEVQVYYQPDGHLNAEGNRIIAEAMAAFLQGELGGG